MSTEAMFRYKAHGEVMIPDLKLPEQTNYPLGKYAMMRLEYLKKHRRGTYTTLLTQAKLNEHLHEVEKAAKEQISMTISRMAQNLGVTEQMKATDPMKWVQTMNGLKAAAEEVLGHTGGIGLYGWGIHVDTRQGYARWKG